MSARPSGEGDHGPAAADVGALAAHRQPAPAPATADGIDTIAAKIRAELREFGASPTLIGDAVGIRFSLKAASAGGLDALAALPEQGLQEIFTRAEVSPVRGRNYKNALAAYRAARDRAPEPPLADQAVDSPAAPAPEPAAVPEPAPEPASQPEPAAEPESEGVKAIAAQKAAAGPKPPKQASPPAKKPAASPEEAPAPKKKRGRPPKKKRGRPPKSPVAAEEDAAPASPAAEEAPAPKKKRGRPRKSPAAEEDASPAAEEAPAPKKKRGRPRKSPAAEEDASPAAEEAPAPKKKRGRPPKSPANGEASPVPAPTARQDNEDLAVGDRVTMGGAPGSIEALPDRGWWKVRLDGEATVRSARRAHIAVPGAAPAPTRKRPGTGGTAPRPAQRPRLVSRGGNDDDDKDARIAALEAALAQAQQAPAAPPAVPAAAPAAPPPTAPQPPAALASVTGRLRELASLRASGALTEAEFARAKAIELG